MVKLNFRVKEMSGAEEEGAPQKVRQEKEGWGDWTRVRDNRGH